jgi:hypothetical protein
MISVPQFVQYPTICFIFSVSEVMGLGWSGRIVGRDSIDELTIYLLDSLDNIWLLI